MTEIVVDAKNVGKEIDGKVILHDISLEVLAGQVVGIMGKNGAGKTTLLDVLLGFSPPTTGSSRVFGSDTRDLSGAIRERIGFVSQTCELIEQISAAQQLAFVESMSPRWDAALVDKMTKDWGIPLHTRIQELSTGARQQLSIVSAMGHSPDLLVLDEPVSSLDPISRHMFMRGIVDVAANETRTVLFSTHLVSDLERVASRILVLRQGTLAWLGDIDALKESVVRLHISHRDSVPKELGLKHAISYSSDGPRASVVVAEWDAVQLRALQSQQGLEVEVENMSLEDIFVELLA